MDITVKPYNATEDNADLDYTTISAGVGFREQNVFCRLWLTQTLDILKNIYFIRYPIALILQLQD